VKRPLPIPRRETRDGGCAPARTGRGPSLLAEARRRLAELSPVPAAVRVRVRCRRVTRDGFVLSALRRYRENDGTYRPADPAPVASWRI
jgi:hypothetical protein